jgi:L-Ala-D/L-Glu epimerase
MSTRLVALRARELKIPFRSSFRHASAERAETSSVWVEAVSASGAIGAGESCPRPYVTGETIAGALAFASAHEADLLAAVADVEAMQAWMSAHADEIDANPAGWCAIELALLDLFGRDSGRTVEALLGLPPLAGSFRFTAVVGDGDADTFTSTVDRYSKLAFTDFKIKLSGDRARDRLKTQTLRRCNLSGMRVRADANNVWNRPDDALADIRGLDFPFFAVEEPIAVGDYAGLARVGAALACPGVLDESLTRASQLAALPHPVDRWIANVRVSKMGGLLRSLDVVRRARVAGLRIIVGAQVGETSLLTRAALPVAAAAGSDLVAQEGAFGTHLLQYDICDPPVMFGAAGVLDVGGRFDAPGWGLSDAGASANVRPGIGRR